MDYLRLDEICNLNMGQSPASDSYNQEGDGIPFFQGNADFGEMYPVTRIWCVKPIKVVDKGALLISVRAPIGALNFAIEKSCIGRGLAGITAKSGYELKYIYYALKYKNEELNNKGTGSTFKAISKSSLGEVLVKNIPIENQKECIKKLDLLHKMIIEEREQIKQLDALIKSRFVEMFGDPIHNPMGWRVKKLGDLSLQINSGNTPKGGEQVYVDKGITFFRSQNVWKDRLEMDDIAYIDAATHASMIRSSLKHGDILMTKTGRINTENSSLGRAALYMGEDDAANVNGHVYFIRLKPEVNNKFILRILVSDEYRDHIRSVCVGGIDKRQLNKDHIEDFPIICPPEIMIEEYIKFVEQVDKLKVV